MIFEEEDFGVYARHRLNQDVVVSPHLVTERSNDSTDGRRRISENLHGDDRCGGNREEHLEEPSSCSHPSPPLRSVPTLEEPVPDRFQPRVQDPRSLVTAKPTLRAVPMPGGSEDVITAATNSQQSLHPSPPPKPAPTSSGYQRIRHVPRGPTVPSAHRRLRPPSQ